MIEKKNERSDSKACLRRNDSRRPRICNKPGLVKVSFQNSQQKVNVSRNKLKNDDQFGKIFMQGAKSRIERLLDTHSTTILRVPPQGKAYRLTGSGRILRKNETGENVETQNAEQQK